MTDFVLKPGVHCVMATPFLPDESLDLNSVDTLLDDMIQQGCVGALILGVLGEADRLTEFEREAVIDRCLKHAGGTLQISVGVTANSTIVTRARARHAEASGATAVMVAPPPGSSAGPVLRKHVRRVADGLQIPVIVQDHPASSGVRMPVEFIADLADFLPPGSSVKVEDPPSPSKIAALRHATNELQLFGGLGGVSLLQELEAGAAGAMTGFAFSGVLVEIIAAFHAGERARARQRFIDILPLIVFEAQPGAGVVLRKEVLKRRGVIAHATVRQPAPSPDALTLRLLDQLLATPLGSTLRERDDNKDAKATDTSKDDEAIHEAKDDQHKHHAEAPEEQHEHHIAAEAGLFPQEGA